MSSVFRHLTLHRIGAGLFVAGVVLLAGGAAGLVVSAASGGSAALWVVGLSGGQALLLGLACLVSSAVVFAHAITHERLARVEAKLDALARERKDGNYKTIT
jgi:hypothetical protein